MKALFGFEASRFEPDFYGAYYDDLEGLSHKELRKHYQRHGAAEGRFRNFEEALTALQNRFGSLPEDFVPAEYLRLNPGLPAEEWRLKLHYLQFGRSEGRHYRPVEKSVKIENIFCSFAKITGLENLVETKPGFAQFTNEDPQILFELLPDFVRHLLIADFNIEIEPLDESEIEPRLYFDYGEGFSEVNSINLAEVSKNIWLARLPLPALAVGFRLDPASKVGAARLVEASLRLTPITPALIACYQGAGAEFAREVQRIASQVGFKLHSEQRAEGDANLSASPDAQRRAYALVAASAFHALNNNPDARRIQYRRWIAQYDTISEKDLSDMREQAQHFPVKPHFSIIMPTYNSNIELLEKAIESILSQTYANFEICIADDCSPNDDVRLFIKKISKRHGCIRYVFREKNGHISECSNSAIELARGDYLVLVDHDDIIPPHALWLAAYYINKHPNAKIIYSDEDKLEEDGGRTDPYFKGDFDHYLMYGHNMVSHLGIYETSIVRRVGGFRKGYEGSQDYDLLLRCADICEARDIVHIPHVLYHWRKVLGSTAISADQKDYAVVAARKAINDHFARKGLPYVSVPSEFPGNSTLAIAPRLPLMTVGVIIPTRDRLEDLRACLESIEKLGRQPNEIVIVDNDSKEPETLEFLRKWQLGRKNARVIHVEGGFNFSALNNTAAKTMTSDVLCFLNNDTEVLSGDWLDRALTHFEVSDIGAVGAKLIYPNNTVQHFGVYLGLGPHKVAGLPHNGAPAGAAGPFSKAALIQQFSAATAACLFVRRKTFKEIGGFDEKLKVAYNDVDLCIRIRNMGFRIIVDPSIMLLHKESATRGYDSTSEKAKRLNDEAEFIREKWADILDSDPFYNPNLSMDHNEYALAFPPRAIYPWKLPSPWQKQKGESRWTHISAVFAKGDKRRRF